MDETKIEGNVINDVSTVDYGRGAVKAGPQPQVQSAIDRLTYAINKAQEQTGMLEDRLALYLRQPEPSEILRDGEDRAEPVPAAVPLLGLAVSLENLADRLGDVRQRFEG